MKYLYILRQALIWVLTIYWLYQLVISFASFIKLKEKKKIIDKKHKFMAIIPAHNEEAVIENLILSLKAQEYPKELYDIYVIADNCSDATAEIAKKAGAIVMKRFDEAHKTKGYALSWFLKQKIEDNSDYDAFCVFDADNIVDKNFLNVMNMKLCQGENVVQGYRDIKNPTDSWISSGYAIFYWMMNKFYHLARYNVGLSPLINGTGFMVRFDIIKPNGWQTKTLTEDIEFSLINISKGRKLGWAVDAVVYDEQPVGFAQSWSQRERWTVGHLQCMKYYLKDLVKGIAKHKKIMNFDGFIYLLGIPFLILSIILVLLNGIISLISGIDAQTAINGLLALGITSFVTPMIPAIVVMLIDKRPIKPMIKGLICYPLFLGSWILINLKCLFKQNTEWEKIKHVKSLKIEDLIPEKQLNNE